MEEYGLGKMDDKKFTKRSQLWYLLQIQLRFTNITAEHYRSIR